MRFFAEQGQFPVDTKPGWTMHQAGFAAAISGRSAAW
jgi:hypothetical protein